MNRYEQGQASANAGEFRASSIAASDCESTAHWLQEMKEWYAGYDAATAAGKNRALNKRFSLRKPDQKLQANLGVSQ